MSGADRRARLAWTAAAVIAALQATVTLGAYAVARMSPPIALPTPPLPDEPEYLYEPFSDDGEGLGYDEPGYEDPSDEDPSYDVYGASTTDDPGSAQLGTEGGSDDDVGLHDLEVPDFPARAGDDGAAPQERRGIWIGGAPHEDEHEEPAPIDEQPQPRGISTAGASDDALGQDVPGRIAGLRELLANRGASADDDGLLEVEHDAPITFDDEVLAATPAGDSNWPDLELPELPWHVTASAIASGVLELAMAVLLLLLGWRSRDLRLGIAGGAMALAVVPGAIDFVKWMMSYEVVGLSTIGAPLLLLGSGLVVLTAPRRRALVLALLVAVEIGRFVGQALFSRWALELFELVSTLLVVLAALRWCVLVAVFLDHARSSRAPDLCGAEGPYRTPTLVAGRADERWWGPRDVLRVASVWLLAVLILRFALAVGLVHESSYADYAFTADLALAIAAVLGASLARVREAHRALGVAAALLFVSPLVSLLDSFYRQRSFGSIDLPFAFVRLDSIFLLVLVSACFVAAVGLLIGGLRIESLARRRSEERRPPRLAPVEVAVVALGAAPLPSLLALDDSQLGLVEAWLLLLAFTAAGAFMLRRHLLRLARWYEDEHEDEAPAEDAAE